MAPVSRPYWNAAAPVQDPGPPSFLGWVSITKDGNKLWSGPSMQSLVKLFLQVAAAHLFGPARKHRGGWSLHQHGGDAILVFEHEINIMIGIREHKLSSYSIDAKTIFF